MDFFVPVALAIDVLAGNLLMRRRQLHVGDPRGVAYLAAQLIVVGCAIAYFLTQGTTQWAILLTLLAAVALIGGIVGISNNLILGGLAIAATIVALVLIALGGVFATVPALAIAGLFASAACVIEGPKADKFITSR
jgi:hypothetical protein